MKDLTRVLRDIPDHDVDDRPFVHLVVPAAGRPPVRTVAASSVFELAARPPGRRRPEPMATIALRDPDLALMPLPLVKEGLTLQDFYESGGWVDTKSGDE